MILYLIRHAKADARGPKYPDDSLRPLVGAGRRQADSLCRAFERLDYQLDRLFTSPYSRAQETAAPLEAHLKEGELETLEALTEGDYPKLITDLIQAGISPHEETEGEGESEGEVVALVGHEPYLSEFASFLLTGDPHQVPLALRKGALLELVGPLAVGKMRLRQMLNARVYRRLAKG